MEDRSLLSHPRAVTVRLPRQGFAEPERAAVVVVTSLIDEGEEFPLGVRGGPSRRSDRPSDHEDPGHGGGQSAARHTRARYLHGGLPFRGGPPKLLTRSQGV